jgi:ribosomal protein L32
MNKMKTMKKEGKTIIAHEDEKDKRREKRIGLEMAVTHCELDMAHGEMKMAHREMPAAGREKPVARGEIELAHVSVKLRLSNNSPAVISA